MNTLKIPGLTPEQLRLLTNLNEKELLLEIIKFLHARKDIEGDNWTALYKFLRDSFKPVTSDLMKIKKALKLKD